MNRTFIFILTVACVQLVKAQYYVRTKKNFGVIAICNLHPVNASFNLSATTPFLQLGVCRQFGKYVVPELGISLNSPASQGQNPSFSGFFSGIEFRKNLFKINERKHGAKCKAELIECFITPEYRLNINGARQNSSGQFSLRYGLGLYHIESGGSKRSRAWVTKVEVYHRNYLLNTSPIANEFGISLRIQHFKTYDFLK